jgi:glycosyltransferase involved in cell wall biosynthesis
LLFKKNVVVLLGYVSNVVAELRQSDIVIGVGRVAIEAMACGKPVIVGSRDKNGKLIGTLIVEDNVLALSRNNFSGRDYSEELSPERLIEILITLLKDTDYREHVGVAGRNYVISRLGIDSIAEKTELAYLNALKMFYKHDP